MKKLKFIPSKSYLNKAYRLLFDSEVNLANNKYDYYHLNEKIYDCEEFQNLVLSEGPGKIVKISSGTSDRTTFNGYIDQLITDLQKDKFYRGYTSPKGNRIARKSLAIMESIKVSKRNCFNENDVCLTSGSTGAITAVFEYIKQTFPNGEILIATPAYYLYKFAAQYWELSFKEIFSLEKELSVEKLIKNITSNTKLIVLTQPSNPTGGIYTKKEVQKLLLIAKRRNILILVDELFFDLIFEPKLYKESAEIACKIDALNNLAVVRGYSKTKNLAGFRIGYLLSKNKKLMSFAEKISEVRQCFPVASNFTGVICLDAFIQSLAFLLNTIQQNKPNKLIKELKKDFKASEMISNLSNNKILDYYQKYLLYFRKILNFYSSSYDLAQQLLKEEIMISMPKKSAFNTFIKVKGMEGINFFDFCFNFYLTCGVETQIGPCYAFNQKTWEEDPNLGFWIRITFARNRKQFIYGLKQFVIFKNYYLQNRDKFLNTGLYF